MTKKDGSFLIARNLNQNFNWQDLKGKTVIPGRKGGVPYMTLEYVLKKNGLDPQKDLILDDSNKIHVIDFSAFNYLPRIIEITAILLGLCLIIIRCCSS